MLDELPVREQPRLPFEFQPLAAMEQPYALRQEVEQRVECLLALRSEPLVQEQEVVMAVYHQQRLLPELE